MILVETTPRGFHSKAAKAAEGMKSEITVQTLVGRELLFSGITVCKSFNDHEKSAKDKCNVRHTIPITAACQHTWTLH